MGGLCKLTLKSWDSPSCYGSSEGSSAGIGQVSEQQRGLGWVNLWRNLKTIQTSFLNLRVGQVQSPVSGGVPLRNSTRAKHHRCVMTLLVPSMPTSVSELNRLLLCFSSAAADPSTSLTGISTGTTSLQRPLLRPFHNPIASTSRPRLTKPLARFVPFLDQFWPFLAGALPQRPFRCSQGDPSLCS